MRYQPELPDLHRQVGFLSLVTLLMMGTLTVFAQVRDTSQMNKAVRDRIIKIISTRESQVKNDTVKGKSKDYIRTQTSISDEIQTIINQDTTKKKPSDTKEVIKSNPRAKEVIISHLPASRTLPDSLVIGNYVILVENYEQKGNWNARTRTFDQVTGTGRIRFSCPVIFIRPTRKWKNAEMKSILYRVVDRDITGQNEISVRDAMKLSGEAKPGNEFEIMMPHVNGKVVDMASYIREVTAVKKENEGGIPVRFSGLSVKMDNATPLKGTVVSGNAKYQTGSALPQLPVTIDIYPGFQLEVSDFTFSPAMDPLIRARLLLPVSLTGGKGCTRSGIELGTISISPKCEFYKEYPVESYGVFGVGNTTLAIRGKGYIVDFSSSQGYALSGKPPTWKGVIFVEGKSEGSPLNTAVSNTGYLQAPYAFTNGFVESSGLTAAFILVSPYRFETAQPLGYVIDFAAATVNVASSQVAGGSIQSGTVTLPVTGVQLANGDPVVLNNIGFNIKPSLDLDGNATVRQDVCMYWGDLIAAGGGNRKSFGASGFTRQVRLFFAAQPRPPFFPVSADGEKFEFPDTPIRATLLDSLHMQGATFGTFTDLIVNSADVPGGVWIPDKPGLAPSDNKVHFRLSGKENCWINVVTGGVHCHVKGEIAEPGSLQLGNESDPLYVGKNPFEIPGNHNKEQDTILLECVESAVFSCNYISFVKLPKPSDMTLKFREMAFTSTADNAGGKLEVPKGSTLAYWGLGLEPRAGYDNSGLVCVKSGQIIITAAGLSEKRHFAEPFWLTWGEIKANGSMGELFFDYNAAGQKFDHFNFIHNAVELSGIDPDSEVYGFLRVGGNAFFPFFGENYLQIIDHYVPNKSGHPYFEREIELGVDTSDTRNRFLPSDTIIYGNWSDGLGVFDFDIEYSAVTQDGFTGTGTSQVEYLGEEPIKSNIEMNSRGTCIRMGSDLMDMRAVSLGPVANLSNINRIWGCVCFKGDCIENMVVGGEVTVAENFLIVARAASSLIAMMQITPALTRFTLDGEAYLSIMAGLDAEIKGHMQLTLNQKEDYVEGEIAGNIKVAAGAFLVGSSLEAQGQVNWHLGSDFKELQGIVTLDVMGFGGGSGIGAGLYIGEEAPKERAWVLLGKDPRYSLNMVPMPAYLTGVYGFVNVHEGINLYIISGGYDIYLGLGGFLNDELSPYVVGNLGGRIYGDILGGLVSASAHFNFQDLLGIDPIGFEGTVGLEACVLWIVCGSVDLTVGLNSAQGFYIQ